jgi:hypothetical protein
MTLPTLKMHGQTQIKLVYLVYLTLLHVSAVQISHQQVGDGYTKIVKGRGNISILFPQIIHILRAAELHVLSFTGSNAATSPIFIET